MLLNAEVFSAHAEVVPILMRFLSHRGGILRARGGSSSKEDDFIVDRMYSPRTRR